ncbi:hypothetical protein Taro_002354 [Colocasia esculenta]|uniref:Uncharacterized protein n=1 Tax=Colocasia esculenta TaxID=4460 RepID=A0A843TCI7_COLES|nr:hypothetical protein [Colocasia esculenta]
MAEYLKIAGLRTPRTRKKLDGSSSPRFLLLLGLFSTSKNPFARARVGHEDLRGYNRIVDHVGIHDQRRLMEALCKGSLVRRKEYPTESSPQAK